ncbi:MAG: dihydrodipicolinate synthase family protein, partial [Phycisphaeraceae bacterium]|nr:dihydrodipicolinate synthase family protein [Phycisphaeraceae bacterium]
MSDPIRGIFCPHVIPFDERGAINESELRRIIDFLIEKGVTGMYPNGSTGEVRRRTEAERRRIIRIVTEQT